MLLALLALLTRPPADEIIPAARARDHLNQRVTVELTVKASKNSANRRTYFLDSEEDFRSDSNLAIVIGYDDAPKFRDAGIDDPASHFFEKTIRVTGTVIDEDDQTRIRVTDPAQIVIVTSQDRRG